MITGKQIREIVSNDEYDYVVSCEDYDDDCNEITKEWSSENINDINDDEEYTVKGITCDGLEYYKYYDYYNHRAKEGCETACDKKEKANDALLQDFDYIIKNAYRVRGRDPLERHRPDCPSKIADYISDMILHTNDAINDVVYDGLDEDFKARIDVTEGAFPLDNIIRTLSSLVLSATFDVVVSAKDDYISPKELTSPMLDILSVVNKQSYFMFDDAIFEHSPEAYECDSFDDFITKNYTSIDFNFVSETSDWVQKSINCAIGVESEVKMEAFEPSI